MTLKRTTLALLIAATLTPLAATNIHAQSAPIQAPERVFTQAELDQMLAPVALYPDALLSQVLMAATYPIEVVEAARWTRANPGLSGDAAVRAVERHDWDPSVTSLVAFPQVLQRMEENPRWTESLGDAFLGQESAVMDTVQQLRRRAQAAGNLQSTEQIRVQQQGQVIVVQSPPEVVYVPYYDPMVVYGNWWWPAYRPVVWAPWPGYSRPRPGVSVGLWFGSPVGVNLNFFFGDFDWGRRHVHVVRPHVHYYRPPVMVVNRTTVINRNVERNGWQHDPHHRRGVAYRAPEVRQRFADSRVERREEQRAERRTGERNAERTAERTTAAPQVVNRPQVQERRQAETAAQPDRREVRRQAQEQARQERGTQREERRVQAPERPRVDAQAEARNRAQADAQNRAQAEAQNRAQAEAQNRAQAEARNRAQAETRERGQAEARERAQAGARERAQQAVRERPQVQPQVRQEAPRAEPRPQADVRERPQAQPQQRQEARQERQEQRQQQRQEPRSERGDRGDRGDRGRRS